MPNAADVPEIYDFLGNKIKIGSKVVYTVSTTAPGLSFGEVVDIYRFSQHSKTVKVKIRALDKYGVPIVRTKRIYPHEPSDYTV